MPIDDEEVVVDRFMFIDDETGESKVLKPLDELPDLSADPGAYADNVACFEKLQNSFGELTATLEMSTEVYHELTGAYILYRYMRAIISGDKRKIKRAKRNHKKWQKAFAKEATR